MKNFTIACLLAGMAMSGQQIKAVAQEISEPSWSGFYAGVHAGYGTSDASHWEVSDPPYADYTVDGFLGGVTLGYNFQWDRIIAGVETDFSLADLDGSESNANCGPADCRASADWLWTLRGRVGIDLDGWMPYVTGGLAVTDAAGSTTSTSGSESITGWTAGGGVEVAAGSNLSFKVEYMYVDVGEEIETAEYYRALLEDLHVVRAGVNYRF